MTPESSGAEPFLGPSDGEAISMPAQAAGFVSL
jgi:hypothetical protein